MDSGNMLEVYDADGPGIAAGPPAEYVRFFTSMECSRGRNRNFYKIIRSKGRGNLV
ncbi:hypothetical protein XYCOK13_15440 [Xylanibacillus composti]|uniref:Uncharacterized protein n=1 Tax=Xylanibacillus composti TaxID=1572762 RepID=A0A8J4M235_9BACL|nr:hypothetical protein XYCOK13_15440 [Xylanibacillus composti]